MNQIAKQFNLESYCVKWEGHNWFENLTINPNNQVPELNLNWSHFNSNEYIDLVQKHKCTIDGTLIHNFFYDLTKTDPREFLKIREQYKPDLLEGTVNVGVHFRGGDKLRINNGREIHTISYYIKGLEEILNDAKVDTIHICTDDTSFTPYKKFLNHVRANIKDIELKLGPATKGGEHIYDFSVLSECDYLLSNSSTYPVCAGFIGKKNKKIIHSLDWIQKNLPETYVKWGNYSEAYPKSYWVGFDNFWTQVYDGGNEFYKAWKII